MLSNVPRHFRGTAAVLRPRLKRFQREEENPSSRILCFDASNNVPRLMLKFLFVHMVPK
jgi:hypothetical protein